VWRSVPHLTLFVDVVLESDISQEKSSLTPGTRCNGEHFTKGIALRRSSLSGLGCRTCGTLAYFSSRLGTVRLILQGTRMSLDVSDSQLLWRQGNDSEVWGGFVEANPPCSELPCATSEGMAVEPPCEPVTTEQPRESTLVEQPGGVVALPVLDVLDGGGEKVHVVGDIEIDDASLSRSGEDDASSEPCPAAAPPANCAEVSIHSVVTA